MMARMSDVFSVDVSRLHEVKRQTQHTFEIRSRSAFGIDTVQTPLNLSSIHLRRLMVQFNQKG